jgi:hypothetical protein
VHERVEDLAHHFRFVKEHAVAVEAHGRSGFGCRVGRVERD